LQQAAASAFCFSNPISNLNMIKSDLSGAKKKLIQLKLMPPLSKPH
jgi:hypothetical protein